MKKAKPRGRGGLIPPEGVDVTEWSARPNAFVTPETKRKHRKSSLVKMWDAGEIDGYMGQASDEITLIYDYLRLGRGVKAPALDRVDCGGVREPSDATAKAHKRRYLPWANELARRCKRGGPPALEIVISVVIDRWNVSDIDHDRRWRHGFAKYLVRRSLLEYAVMAGWAGIEELMKFDGLHETFARRAA